MLGGANSPPRACDLHDCAINQLTTSHSLEYLLCYYVLSAAVYSRIVAYVPKLWRCHAKDLSVNGSWHNSAFLDLYGYVYILFLHNPKPSESKNCRVSIYNRDGGGPEVVIILQPVTTISSSNSTQLSHAQSYSTPSLDRS